MSKYIYGWENIANGCQAVSLAIPKISNPGILRAHRAVYNLKTKTLEISDGYVASVFKFNNKKQAEYVISTYRGVYSAAKVKECLKN